ncbi:MAG: ABC transporter ATP-binding protein [Lachnospiraceae bacterium]|nr:ABC transporter ATP-binding protein [Lachnospiraceae bacterium]
METVVRLVNATKIYAQAEVKTTGIMDVSMEVKEGDFIAVTGRSGCGKSTLLNILGLMDDLTEGQYLFFGKDVAGIKGKEAAEFRNHEVGFIFQAFNLVNEISVLENVCMPLGYAGVGKQERRKRAAQALALVGLEDKTNKRPIHLSGGEQQRVAIARAIVNEPKLLLADEPTGNLDEENSRLVMELLTKLNSKGMTVIMVTHSPEMADYAKSRIQIRDGRIVS